MSGGSRIIAFGSSGDGSTEGAGGQEPATGTAGDDPLDLSSWVAEEEEPVAEEEWEPPQAIDSARGPLIVAIAAIAAWTGFYLWANRGAALGATPAAEWASLIAAWSMPVMLVGVIWLIAMRSSARQASRFGDAARLLSQESALLEGRLLTVNRELSLAREFIAAQSRDLESLGRLASERLSGNADRLQSLITENGARVETIGHVSETALANMEKLRGQLPVIASSAKDVTNNIGNAGRTAHAHIEEMVRGFTRVNEFGQACESQIFALREHVSDTLAELAKQCEQLETHATARFAELGARSEDFRNRLDRHEIDALASIRTRADALTAELEATRATAQAAEQECLDTLAARMAALRDESGAFTHGLREGQQEARQAWSDALAALETDRAALFERIAQADEEAGEAARARLAAIEAEASLIEGTLAERAARIATEQERHRSEIDAAQRDLVGGLGELLAGMDRDIEARSQDHARLAEETANRAAALADRVAVSQSEFERIAQDARDWEARIGDSLTRLQGLLSDAQARLDDTEGRIGGLTDASLRLFELVHASAEQAENALPRSLGQSDASLASIEARAATVSADLERIGAQGLGIAAQLDGSRDSLVDLVARLEETQRNLRDRASEHLGTLGELAGSLERLDQHNDSIAEKARTQLAQAIAEMEEAASRTLSLIETQGAQGVELIAREIESRSAQAVGQAIHNAAAEISGQLEQAASHAAGVSREATIQLRDQLGKVHELVANLENRVAQARERAEEQVDNDFARRAALITESLNSNAIDIAKALSVDVSDTAWQGYLRGDRGIFTRRAVSLIDAGEARAILQIFERDNDFREHVNRYIHDFEAMLRLILSTRDGTALGVTMLSSDMGKLYVALAQAIERLRK